AAAYAAVGQLDRAIGDYDRALEVQPDYALGYFCRGGLYLAQGRYQQAIADYDAGIRLRPDYANSAITVRGVARFGSGEFSEAARDFEQSVGSNPLSAAAVLWLHLARQRAGVYDREEYARNARALAGDKWPAPLVELFLREPREDVHVDVQVGS